MKRNVEVFTAGCGVCDDLVNLVRLIACSSCDVSVLDMKDPDVAERGKAIGIRSVPAVAINGKLADCCTSGGYDEATLRNAGIGSVVGS
jgi:glutaredoxin 3